MIEATIADFPPPAEIVASQWKLIDRAEAQKIWAAEGDLVIEGTLWEEEFPYHAAWFMREGGVLSFDQYEESIYPDDFTNSFVEENRDLKFRYFKKI